MGKGSSKAWTPTLEKEGEGKLQGLFLILLIWGKEGLW